MFCLIKNVWDFQGIGFNVKAIKYKLMTSTTFLCLTLFSFGCDGLALAY